MKQQLSSTIQSTFNNMHVSESLLDICSDVTTEMDAWGKPDSVTEESHTATNIVWTQM